MKLHVIRTLVTICRFRTIVVGHVIILGMRHPIFKLVSVLILKLRGIRIRIVSGLGINND